MPPADRFVAALAVLPALALGGCTRGSSAPAPTSAAPVVIAAGLLDTLARERGLGRDQALNLAVEDALLARQLELTDPTLAGWIEQTVLAQQLLGVLAGEARAAGPPTDAEVRELTEARFWELDRPRMVRVVHAVVLSPKEDAAARALADRIGQATLGTRTPEEFQARARAVPAEKFTVKVEALAPVTEDGRAVDPDRPPPIGPAVQHYNQAFAAAAQRLQRPGEMSPVVHTSFGYHVLYLMSVVEPRQPTLDERRALLHDEIMKARAKALTTALLDRLRRELAPQQERSALASMQALGAER